MSFSGGYVPQPLNWPGFDIPKPGRGVRMFNPGQTEAGVAKTNRFAVAFAEMYRYMPADLVKDNQPLLAASEEWGAVVDGNFLDEAKAGDAMLQDIEDLADYLARSGEVVKKLKQDLANWSTEMAEAGALDTLILFDLMKLYSKMPGLVDRLSPAVLDKIVKAVAPDNSRSAAKTPESELAKELVKAEKEGRSQSEALKSYLLGKHEDILRVDEQAIRSQRRVTEMEAAREPVGHVGVSIATSAMQRIQRDAADNMEKRLMAMERGRKMAEKESAAKHKKMIKEAAQQAQADKKARLRDTRKGGG